jgi:hypothetical protein
VVGREGVEHPKHSRRFCESPWVLTVEYSQLRLDAGLRASAQHMIVDRKGDRAENINSPGRLPQMYGDGPDRLRFDSPWLRPPWVRPRGGGDGGVVSS